MSIIWITAYCRTLSVGPSSPYFRFDLAGVTFTHYISKERYIINTSRSKSNRLINDVAASSGRAAAGEADAVSVTRLDRTRLDRTRLDRSRLDRSGRLDRSRGNDVRLSASFGRRPSAIHTARPARLLSQQVAPSTRSHLDDYSLTCQ